MASVMMFVRVQKDCAVNTFVIKMQKFRCQQRRTQKFLQCKVYAYGMEVKELKLLTGRSYLQTLILSAKCLYQKEEGPDQPWYARRVTADGYFLEEVEMEVGYSNGAVVCVSGINEGDYFDTGYQAIAKEKAS